jgi:hypothetical protein
MPPRVTVTVMRGNPLSVGPALLLAAAGAVPMVLGFLFPVDVFPSSAALDVVLWTLAVVIAVPGWLLAWVVWRSTRRADREPIGPVPEELPEPPSDHDAAQVAVLVGEGRPSRRAIAGTVLELADRGAITIEEYGERLVIRIEPDAQGESKREQVVLDGLRANVDDSGEVVGPPVWKHKVSWWRTFAREARGDMIQAGLVHPAIPLVALTIGLIFTVVAISIPLFNPFLLAGIVPFFIGVTHALANIGGYKLPREGRELRARWAAYARYLAAQGSVRDVGPAAIAIWGPNLSYGVVLGQAERAARPLTPGATEDDIPTPFETVAQSLTSGWRRRTGRRL